MKSVPTLQSEIDSPNLSGAYDAPTEISCPLSPLIRADALPGRWTSDLADSLAMHGCPLGDMLSDRLQFERLLVDLSVTFINLPSANVDSQVTFGLRQLGEYLKIGCISFGELSDDSRDMVVSHSYVAPGGPPVIVDASLPWDSEQLLRGTVSLYSRLPDELPADAIAERDYCISLGLKSTLSIPLRVDGSLQYVITFATLSEHRSWPEDLIERLWLVGEIFANALARKKREVETQQLRDQLARMGRITLVGQLATAIAHEVKQPLCAIVANAQAGSRLLASETPDLNEVRETLQDIASDGNRANDIVMRVGSLVKSEVLKPTPLDINEVIGDLLALIRGQLLGNGVTLSLHLTEQLPRVFGDRILLQQVILNLLLNAIEAMSHVDIESRHLTITSEVHSEDQILVVVEDTGPGIENQRLEKIFETFYTTKPSGIGVGLAISRTIIKSHGGKIWATSGSTEGAVFHFTVPTAQGDADVSS